MKCKHDKISRLVEQDGMVADGFCPVCLQEQLALAVKVIEAAEQYKRYVEYYFRGKISRYRDCVDSRTELDNAIAKFKGGQDDKH